MSKGPIQLPIYDQALRLTLRQCARRSAAVAGGFVAIVAILMLAILIRERPDGLAKETRTDPLKKQLAAAPSDAIKEAIRQEDLRLRAAYFYRRAMLLHGAWLLIGGAAVLALSVKLARDFSTEPYLPSGPRPGETDHRPRLAWSLSAAGLLLAAVLLAIGLSLHGANPLEAAAVPTASAAAPTNPAPARATLPPDAWPAFRGIGGIGVTSGDYPTQWDGPTGTNVLWKSPVPLPGNNSPIVCSARVFLSGGSIERREIYCFDANTGALKWARSVGASTGAADKTKLSSDTGWAPSTLATDGARVFAIFPTAELACFDLDGQPLWNKNLGPLKNNYGHASSLLTFDNLLIVQLDQGERAEDGLSAILAFDAATGKPVWKTPRPVEASWSTPALIPGPAGPELIALANPWIISYDPRTGKELWRAKELTGEIAPSPAFAAGFVYAATEQSRLVQVRLGGRGDVSQTHFREIDSDAPPDIVSPVAVGDRVILVQTAGTIALVDPKAGKDVWTKQFEAGFKASPIAVGNRVYLTDSEGVTHVIELADQFKQLSESPLGEEVTATPAFSAGRIYLRGKQNLYCIGAASKGGAP